MTSFPPNEDLLARLIRYDSGELFNLVKVSNQSSEYHLKVELQADMSVGWQVIS